MRSLARVLGAIGLLMGLLIALRVVEIVTRKRVLE